MTVSDNTIQADGLGNFFENLGKKGHIASKKMAKIILKNPGPTLDKTTNIASAAATINPKEALSTLPDVISFYHTGKGLHLEKVVSFYWI